MAENMHTTTNEILKDQYSSQNLQNLSTYYLKLEPANSENVLGSLISPKEEVKEEWQNVTDLEPANYNVLIHPKIEADCLISVKKEEEEHNMADLEPANYEDVLLDPKIEANSLISVKEERAGHNETDFPKDPLVSNILDSEAIHSRPETTRSTEMKDIAYETKYRKRQEGENLYMEYAPENKVRNYPQHFDSTQLPQKDKTFDVNEEAKSIYMKSERMKKKDTFVSYEEKNQKLVKNEVNADVDIRSENKLEDVIANVVVDKQKIAKPCYNKDTQNKYVNDDKTSLIKTDIFFQCNECAKRFSTKAILTNHILKCIKTTETSVTKEQLLKEDTLNPLLLERPLVLEMFSCDICTFKTYNKRSIETHSKMHIVTKVFSCNICEYKTAHKSHLQNHMAIHTGERPFSCNICEYTCALKGNLSKHMKKHTGEKPFACNMCDYRCAQKHGLMRHMRKHTGEEPFSCNICEYRCARKEHLKEHLTKHTGEKPFSCNFCKYGCFRKTHLNRHMRTHTGEKPFSCNICEYKCAVKHNLKLHLKTHRHFSKTKLISSDDITK